jgi:two-component system, OmpR family, sensor kinase
VSLQVRLTLTYTILVAATLTAFSFVLYASLRQNLEFEMDRRLQVRASQVELTLLPSGNALRAEDLAAARLSLAPLATLNAPSLYVQVLDRSVRVVARSDNLGGESLPIDTAGVQAALAGRRVFNDVTAAEDEPVRILSIPISIEGTIEGVLQVGQSRQPLQDAMAGLRQQLQLLGLTALAVAGAVGWLVAHRGLRPLRDMGQQAILITARRNFRERLRAGRARDEVGGLAATINGLLATVDQTLETHREFVADASHELRNPLLAIRTNLDLLDRVIDPVERAECVREAREQVARMSRLVADLLLLARTESGQLVELRPVALTPLVAQVVHDARRRTVGQEITTTKLEEVEVRADEGRLAQILTNLLENAFRHTPAGGTVSVDAGRRAGWAYVRVSDNGEGIAAEDLPNIFQRFYRGRASNPSDGSTGLGLAIVKHLVEAHGGQVAVQSELGNGTSFTVWLQLQPAAQEVSAEVADDIAMSGSTPGQPALVVPE